MIMATLIKIDGTIETLTNTNLDTLQKAVGGYIEIVNLPNGRLLVVDEEGLLKKKDINIKASTMYGNVVVGDVVLCRNDEID